jgi:hypothetical protein
LPETQRRERRLDRPSAAAQDRAKKFEIFGHAQSGLRPVEMADKMRRLPERPVRRSAFEHNSPPCRLQESGDQPQQRRFPGPVPPDDRKRLAAREREAEIPKQLPPAANTGQLLGN